jgi:hypothetical protein
MTINAAESKMLDGNKTERKNERKKHETTTLSSNAGAQTVATIV